MESGKVREIARIRGFGDRKLSNAPSIFVQKLEGKPSSVISFSAEQSTSSKPFNYEVDQCYDHEAGNDVVFNEEIKPLISSVFEGKSATVFAYGARGSGKTFTIQGSENVPGLISLSMSEFVARAQELGNSVFISLYEIVQDRVLDLLNSKKPEISVLEGAYGKIVLKGLSKATIKSMSEFDKLWCSISQRPLQKMTNEPPQRSHRGMIINISSSLEDVSLLGRMNIVDLAGYEDKRQSTNGANLLSISKINKSLYAVHNVLHALKNNETRVPYRESKLTRMLQESLGGMNKILMITCMDPLLPEDTIKSLSLATRSSQVVNMTKADHTPRVKSSIKPYMTPTSSFKQNVTQSSKPLKVATSSFKQNVTQSSKPLKVASSSASARKQSSSFSTPQANKVQGRKLFEELKSVNTKKRTVSKKYIDNTESPRDQEEKLPESNMEVIESSRDQEGKNSAIKDIQPSLHLSTNEEGNSSVNTIQPISEVLSEENNVLICQTPVDHQNLVTPDIVQADKENKSSTLNEAASPPLSIRLQELSNHLKSLYASTPMNINTEIESYSSSVKANDNFLEPSTPISQPSNSQYATSLMSPWERLKVRSSGMKNSLVDECLTFLNSASKEELKSLKGIGETRATYILKLRGESPEPFKSLEDLKEIGLSSKQIKGMMKKVADDLFD